MHGRMNGTPKQLGLCRSRYIVFSAVVSAACAWWFSCFEKQDTCLSCVLPGVRLGRSVSRPGIHQARATVERYTRNFPSRSSFVEQQYAIAVLF